MNYPILKLMFINYAGNQEWLSRWLLVFLSIFPFLGIDGLIDGDVCDGVYNYEYLLFMRCDDMFM